MRGKSLMFTSDAAICFAAASFLAVDANYGKDREKDLLTKNLEALTNCESEGTYVCHNGGPGARGCSIAGGIEIIGCGISANCSVDCYDGFYACCGIKCSCIRS